MSRFLRFGMAGILAVATMTSGCVLNTTGIAKNETPIPATPLPVIVPPAPKQLYIKVGQIEQFTYWNHDIVINYTSSYPNQIIKVFVDGAEKTFQKELTESPTGIYWKEGNLSFTIKPVTWEIRNSQNIPIYESTWNTTEIYFKVQGTPASEITGGPQR